METQGGAATRFDGFSSKYTGIMIGKGPHTANKKP
jgi:hypothetical protein